MTALVLGGAECVWRDWARAQAIGEYDAVIAVNDMVAAYAGPLEAAVSLHADKLANIWLPDRLWRGFPRPANVWGPRDDENMGLMPPLTGFVAQFFQGQTENGSSGLFGLKAALDHLGHARAVLCGVPMDGQPHFFDDKEWPCADDMMAGWLQAFDAIKDRARSMSGWTAELLGKPDKDWVAGAC